MHNAETSLHDRLSALDALLTALLRDGRVDVEDPRTKDVIRSQMSQILAMPGGSAALVARYAADKRVAVVRPLAFLLGVAVNDRDQADALSETVFAMISGLQTDDPWARLNLCTAVQRLLMFGAVSGSEAPKPGLSKLLLESLDGIPPLRATAATVVADLFYGRHTAVVSAADLAILQTRLLELTDDETDELTRKEAQGLREFLEKLLSD